VAHSLARKGREIDDGLLRKQLQAESVYGGNKRTNSHNVVCAAADGASGEQS